MKAIELVFSLFKTSYEKGFTKIESNHEKSILFHDGKYIDQSYITTDEKIMVTHNQFSFVRSLLIKENLMRVNYEFVLDNQYYYLIEPPKYIKNNGKYFIIKRTVNYAKFN